MSGRPREMNGYSGLAPFYDLLMEFDYDRLAAYYRALFHRHGHSPSTVVDLCCGTGQVTARLAGLGYDMTGVDLSPDMLSAARERCPAESGVLLLCQDICKLDLNDTADAMISALDGINHLSSEKALQKAFQRMALFCNDNALLIFDLHSRRKFYKMLAGRCFTFDHEKVYCVWQTHLLGRQLRHTLDFFVPDGPGKATHTRRSDDFSEYYYDRMQIETALAAADFELLEVLGDMTFKTADEDSHERIFYLARRRARAENKK